MSAAALGRDLGLDPGYLSRILTALEGRGLIDRSPSPGNLRRRNLGLTAAGRARFNALDRAADAEVAARLAGLGAAERERLVAAMRGTEELLGRPSPGRTFVLRAPEPGDYGWIIHRHGVLYGREYGWDTSFEALVAEIIGCFVRDGDPGRERCWVALGDGQVVGSVFLVRQDDATAKLRLLYVEPAARGQGLGRQLVGACLAFARTCGYRRIELWTNDVLVSARRIYCAAGFVLVSEAPHRSFGHDLIGQTWALDL